MSTKKEENPDYFKTDKTKVILPEVEWKKILSPEVFYVARQKGTERPFTSRFEDFKEIGTYYCAVCGNHFLKATRSLKVVVAGQVFTSLLVK